jgi:integrase
VARRPAPGARVSGTRSVKIPYTSVRNGNRFFEPRGRMLEHGFVSRSLGPEGEPARAKAWRLYEDWLFIRDGVPKPPTTKIQTAAAARVYPAGSLGEAWQVWIRTEEWEKLAPSTRNKIWWEAWLKRIEPCFGDVHPDTITMPQLSLWRKKIEETSGLDPAHKALKIFRAFWRVLQALRYTQLSDPSAKVVNTAPQPRTQRYSHAEAMRLAKTAWRAGFRGLACIIIVAWDTGFSPKDARTLRKRHLQEDPKTRRIVFDLTDAGRAKTGVKVIGTLSRFGDWLVRRAIGDPAAGDLAMLDEAFLFRMRGGNPYGESRLGGDFALVRAMVNSNDRRQLRDMRRSGVMEVFTGGGFARDVSEKFGNSIDRSSFLFKTYNPVDLDKVRQADNARLEGRRRKNKS